MRQVILTTPQRAVLANEMVNTGHGGSRPVDDDLVTQAMAADQWKVSVATLKRLRQLKRQDPGAYRDILSSIPQGKVGTQDLLGIPTETLIAEVMRRVAGAL